MEEDEKVEYDEENISIRLSNQSTMKLNGMVWSGMLLIPGDGIIDDRAVDVLRQGSEPLHGGHRACLDGLVDDLTEDAEH